MDYQRLLHTENKYPKRDGLDTLLSLGLESIDIYVPPYLQIPGGEGYEGACRFVDKNRQEIVTFIENGPEDREFLAIRSSGNVESPGENTSKVVPTASNMVFIDLTVEGEYEDVVIANIKKAICEVYDGSNDVYLEILFQFFGANTNKNYPKYGEENTTCILKLGFPDIDQAYLTYIDGLNAVDYNGDIPAYLFTQGKTYHLPYNGGYYSGEYLTQGLAKIDTEIKQNTLHFLDDRGNFKREEYGGVPKKIDAKQVQKVEKLIRKLREEGIQAAELELTILPNGELWVYQLRVDTLLEQSGDFYIKSNLIKKSVQVELDAIGIGFEKISTGITIGLLPRNKIKGFFQSSYQILYLSDIDGETGKDKQVKKVIQENQGEKILVIIGSSDSGAIERGVGSTYEGFIYIGGNVASHAVGHTVHQMKDNVKKRFVVITDMDENERTKVANGGEFILFYNSDGKIAVCHKEREKYYLDR